MFCLLVVLVELSVLAEWLARKSPLRKPNRGEGIVCRKPRPKSVHDFLGLLYCFIVLLCICVVSCPYVIYYPTAMAWYSLFVLKVPLNPKQTKQNKQTTTDSTSVCAHFGLPLPFIVSVLHVSCSLLISVSSPPFVQFLSGNSASNLHEPYPLKICSINSFETWRTSAWNYWRQNER